MKHIIYISFLLLPLVGLSQKYADKAYYLVDSLVLSELSSSDITLLDSCLNLYHKVEDDTSKVKALQGICDKLVHDDWKKYQIYQYEKIREGLKNNESELVIEVFNKYLLNALNNMGTIYFHHGNIAKGLEFYYESLELSEKYNDQAGIANSLSKIGLVHYEQGDHEKAKDFYERAIVINRRIGQFKGVLKDIANIARSYYDKEEYNKAIDYLRESKNISDSVGDLISSARATSNMGGIYKMLGDSKKALELYKEGLTFEEKIGDVYGIGGALGNIGLLYYEMGDFKKAESYGLRSMELAKEIGFALQVKTNAKLLSNVYFAQGKFKLSLEMYKLEITMRDSLNNESTQKAAIQQQAKYEYEKQKAVDDAEHDKEIAIEHEAKEKQTILTYATGGGLGLVAIFLLVVFNRLKVTRKQKNIIEAQKTEVENQKNVVELAHTELEEKNKEITDSIQYAKRIQNAILPPNKVVKKYLQESYIYYKPKDIVAGDFYWLEHSESKVLFAAADCTGHGVPGAMVSVVCNNGLNRSVREFGLTDPGEILNKTREIVVQEFEKSEEEVKDGMDIALCTLEGNRLQYAGAHNPLWIIRKDAEEIEEIKANKQPIGQFDNPEPYTTHTIYLQKGDSLYIFSDGYADQFGGEKGKKLKTANFKKLLLSIQNESMEKQKQLIDEAFDKWKGDLEQLDDVCVIGVRI